MIAHDYIALTPPIINRFTVIFADRPLYSLDETKLRYGHNTEQWAEVDRYARCGMLGNIAKLHYASKPGKKHQINT